jgi:hypothetical protein
MPEDLYQRIKILAAEYSVSLNEMVNLSCEEFLRSGKIEFLEKKILKLEKELETLKTQK